MHPFSNTTGGNDAVFKFEKSISFSRFIFFLFQRGQVIRMYQVVKAIGIFHDIFGSELEQLIGTLTYKSKLVDFSLFIYRILINDSSRYIFNYTEQAFIIFL